MAKVSVIMGIYNCESTLQEALDSLYAQTFQDFEIILCDDGSLDGTYELALDNQEKHSNIIVLKNQQNMGLNITLNKCISVAQGEYIARMDGDDISAPTRFEKEVHFLDNHKEYSIVSCSMVFFDENGEFGRECLSAGEPQVSIFNYGAPFCHAPCMVRKEAYLSVGCYSVNRRLIRVEDYNLWMKMYAAGYRGYNLGEYLYYMRDDRKAMDRRTVKARLNGIYAHWIAYKTLDLSFYRFVRYSIGNIIRMCLPVSIYSYFHKRKMSS